MVEDANHHLVSILFYHCVRTESAESWGMFFGALYNVVGIDFR